jgi:hypothetical protein
MITVTVSYEYDINSNKVYILRINNQNVFNCYYVEDNEVSKLSDKIKSLNRLYFNGMVSMFDWNFDAGYLKFGKNSSNDRYSLTRNGGSLRYYRRVLYHQTLLVYELNGDDQIMFELLL